jgi:hypothetical protein
LALGFKVGVKGYKVRDKVKVETKVKVEVHVKGYAEG